VECEECARRKADDVADELEYTRGVQRNHAYLLIGLLVAVLVIAHRLNAKGLLSYGELLGTADG